MSKLKNEEFHIPFIKSLVFVGLVTVVSMISAKIFIQNYYSNTKITPQYTSDQSQIIIDFSKIKSINPSSH